MERNLKQAQMPKYALGDRRYLIEKVVVSYEKLWAGDIDAVDFKELFLLKANAQWLSSHVAAATTVDLLTTKKPVVRRIFTECCARLVDDSAAADVQCHAMETVSGLFLGLGSRTFHDPVSEVLELLCGLEAADDVFPKLFAHLKKVLAADRRGAANAALRRSAVRLLLSLTAAASDLHNNVLVDLLMPHGFEQPIASLLLMGGGDASTSAPAPANGAAATTTADGGGAVRVVTQERPTATAIEDVALLLVLLAAYRRHESPNAFLRLLGESSADAPHLQALAHISRRVLERCMYPVNEESTTTSYLGAGWSHSFARYAEWAAHTLTLEAYLPTSITSQLSSLRRSAPMPRRSPSLF